MLFVISCKSKSGIENISQYKFEFDYIKLKSDFEMELIKFQRNLAHCGTEGLPYALLIGKTDSEFLPKKMTVLSYCDDRIFKVGDKLKIELTDNPTKRTSLNPIYFVKDTIISGIERRWIIGSENKTVWGRPTKLNQ